LLDIISLEYHETLMAGAGQTVTDALRAAADKYAGQFICIAEGSVPTAHNGIYGMIGDKTMLSIAEEICPKAKTLITFGNCSSFGGIAAAAPNPTGARGVREAVKGLCTPIVKIPGCAPNPLNLIATLANYLLKGALPGCDPYGRPEFAYKETIHNVCPWDHGRCSEEIGCKGMKCKNNCTDILFNDESYPMNVGHPCIACSEPEFWDKMSPFYKEVPDEEAEKKYQFDEKWVLKPCGNSIRPVNKTPAGNAPGRASYNLRGQRIRSNKPSRQFLVKGPGR
jgi:[NiFe] hydrogenase small subunit